MPTMPVSLRQKDKVRGKCDYCHKQRQIGLQTLFCDECLYEWNRVTDKYLDGDPLTPLKAAAVVDRQSR